MSNGFVEEYWYSEYKDPQFDNKFVIISGVLCEVWLKYYHDNKDRLKSYYYYTPYNVKVDLKRYYPNTKHRFIKMMRIKRARELFPEEFL